MLQFGMRILHCTISNNTHISNVRPKSGSKALGVKNFQYWSSESEIWAPSLQLIELTVS